MGICGKDSSNLKRRINNENKDNNPYSEAMENDTSLNTQNKTDISRINHQDNSKINDQIEEMYDENILSSEILNSNNLRALKIDNESKNESNKNNNENPSFNSQDFMG